MARKGKYVLVVFGLQMLYYVLSHLLVGSLTNTGTHKSTYRGQLLKAN